MSTLGVNAVIIGERGILLVRRCDLDLWELPGGAVDDVESVSQAVVRETLEETGLVVEVEKLLGVYSRPLWRKGGDHCILLACRVVGGAITVSTAETWDSRYFDRTTLPTQLWPPHRTMINDVGRDPGSPVVRTLAQRWPFPDGLTWEEVVRLQRGSGLTAIEFFQSAGDCEDRSPRGPADLVTFAE